MSLLHSFQICVVYLVFGCCVGPVAEDRGQPRALCLSVLSLLLSSSLSSSLAAPANHTRMHAASSSIRNLRCERTAWKKDSGRRQPAAATAAPLRPPSAHDPRPPPVARRPRRTRHSPRAATGRALFRPARVSSPPHPPLPLPLPPPPLPPLPAGRPPPSEQIA